MIIVIYLPLAALAARALAALAASVTRLTAE